MDVLWPLKRAALVTAKRAVKLAYHDTKVASAYLRSNSLRKLSILCAHTGAQNHESGAYAIFLIWQPQQFPWYIENALDALNAAAINPIIVVNHDLGEERLAYLKARSHLVIIRDNTGLDIGGYRDATLYLTRTIKNNLSRVIYMNDSVYYFRENLENVFERLSSSSADICGTFENWEHNYHIQSFCFSVSGHLFLSGAFQQFWQNYIPVNSRLWAIQQGEIGLSKIMVPLSERIEIIYRPNDLIAPLSAIGNDHLGDLNNLLPRKIRFTASDLKKIPMQHIPQAFANKVSLRSQVHTGAFLYRKFLGCPIMKRDLVYRLQFSIDEIEKRLQESGDEGHLRDIVAEMERKGTPEHLSLVKQVRVAVGIL
ncbi:rhamnan synthesis F family protein [Brucella intermedia]|uniref:rhamnan synthesis F family protein n=1 Tax=Brucella intermedia TaxID=94625 RepID=UPI001E371B5E|nr:rhamnan synthesis F family protein [Brucella intermedia]MCB4918490.1 rhamnan synthesis F family protein [Brucella intermedia]